MREPLEKKLRDEVKISKWDEQSYYALVDSTERNHRKLMKLLREYDNILDMPISAMLEQHYNDGIRSQGSADAEMCIKVPNNREIFPLFENDQNLGIIKSQLISSTGPPEKIPSLNGSVDMSSHEFVRRLPHYYKRLTSIVEIEIIKATSWGQISATNSSAMSSEIFERIDLLRKDKTTKQMKQRALTDLFRVLKQNGFKTTKWSVPAQLRQIVHLFQLPVPPSLSFLSTFKLQSLLDSARTYFERTVTEVRRLQAEISIFGSKHMTKRETQIMQYLSEHGLLLISQQKSIVSETIREISNLKARIDVLSSLSSGMAYGQDKLLGPVHDFGNALQAAKESVGQLRLFISTSLEMSKTAEISTSKRDTISVLDQCLLLMQNDISQKIEIVTSKDLDDLVEAKNNLIRVEKFLHSIQKTCCHDHAFLPIDVFDTCISMVRTAIDISDGFTNKVVKPDLEKSVNVDFSIFLQSTSRTLKLAIFAVQNIHKSSVSSKPEDDASLSQLSLWDAHMRFCQELEGLNIGEIATCLKQTIDNLVLLHSSTFVSQIHERTWALSVTIATHLMVKQVYLLSLSRLEDAISSFRNNAKLQYILSRVFRVLVSKGYCADKSEENSGGDDIDDITGMKFEDDVEGTGMGEGDGKQDVTDQLESEEQIQGLKGEDQNETKENQNDSNQLDEEEAKQGMEMREDFEGDMFDVPDEIMDENEDNREEEEEEELDREMGMEANNDEEVVDEKMWGDSDNEDDIDQEEEKFERDSNVKGEALEDEMRTKEDGEDNDSPDIEDTKKHSVEQEEHSGHDDENDSILKEDKEENYEDKHGGVDVREDDDDCDEGGEAGDDDDAMDIGDDVNVSDDDNTGNETDNEAEDQPNIEDQFDSEIGDVTEDPEEKEDDQGGDDAIEATTIPDGSNGEQNEDGKEDEDEQDGPRVNQSAEENSEHEAFGVRSKGGADNIRDHDGDEEEDDDDDAAGGQHHVEGVGDEDCQEDPSSGADGDGVGRGNEQEDGFESKDSTAEKSSAPNPFKNPGDATKFWHKKLQMVERKERQCEGNEIEEDEVAPMGGDDNEDKYNENETGEFEYTDKNEDSSAQVMGESTNEIKNETSLEEKRIKEEEFSSGDEAENKSSKRTETVEKEQKSSKTRTKPSDSSKTLNDDFSDSHEESDADMLDSCESSKGDRSESDDISMNENDSEEDGNKVVSDLNQLCCLDENDQDAMTCEKIVDEDQITGISSQEMEDARARWNKILGETNSLSRRLCEQLRLVMEPLLATKLKGDYRTGKRINMKKVIGYIASGYRKDKIWLRRTKPAKRNYRILLAVDNSESMSSSGAGEMALAAMATLATGMSQLEVGELGIASFGDEMRLLHPFHLPFTSESGSNIVHNFPFDEKRTRTALCVESALTALDMAGCDRASLQLVFLISDGRIERDSRSNLRRLMREMVERNILLVMIVVEGQRQSVQEEGTTGKKYRKKKDSIAYMKEVTFENGKPKVKQFIEDYPFPYYIILEELQSLPEVLGNALRQWFEMIAQLQHNP